MFVAKNNRASKPTSTSSSRSNSSFIQPKLNVGKPGDKYEVEADKMADQVVAKSNEPATAFIAPTPNIQKQAEEEVQKQEEPTIQEKPLAESITPVVQLKPLDTIQKQPEEEVQAKEEEEVQQKEEELQTKKDIQLVEEEEVQTKEEEEVQKKEEKDIQTKEEENVQPKQEEIQQKTETEPIQLKENNQLKPETLNPIVQKQQNEEVQTKEDEEIQEKEEEEVQTLQMQASVDTGDTSSIENNLNNGGGSPLASNTKNEMESGFGADFGGVRVHNDSNAVQMNKELGSQAFTNGNDIYFNDGKYNPSSDSGKHLLAHELTHTVQQGASSQPTVQKVEETTESNTESTAPTTPLDISHRFELTSAWSTYLDAKYAEGERIFDVDVKIGEQYRGVIKVNKMRTTAEGENAKYELSRGNHKYLNISGWSFLDPMRQAGVTPILVLRKFGDEQQTKGFLSVKIGDNALVADADGFIRGLNEKLEEMQFLGIEPINVDGIENNFENGRLVFQVSSLTTVVDGYLEAGGGMGITGSSFTFNLNANVDIAGLASGEFTIARAEDGGLSGTGEIQAEIANVQAIIRVEYIDGAVTIQGTGSMNSDKFSGEITLLVTDATKSRQMMNAALGVETMDAEAGSGETAPKTANNQVLAGWGEIQASITPWLEGTAKVGIDNEGHVTIVGEIVVPDEIELMEQRGKKTELFDVEIRAGYGIPLVGQVFLFASVGMFINAGFGPLVLKDIGFTGTYSTDPSVLQQFSVTGTLGINAFAIIGLEAEAGVGVTILGHDVKAGVNVTAAAGLRAYAEATPTLEYQEQATPEGGKTGETRLKGHFEAAAQLFLQLTGALFYELDSPWWSPAPDGREEYPLGEVQYPIGDSLGIGADMDWLVGSDEAPELTFSPVEFDPDKFTADVMADPPPRTRGDADASPEGEWTGEPGSEQQTDPTITGEGEGLPESDRRRQENLANLPDEQKYMRALDEMSTLESINPKPTYEVVNAKATRVKRKYGLEKIELKNRADESVDIYVKHRNQDNTRHLVHISLMSAAERGRILLEAMTDLRTRETRIASEDGKLTQDQARELLTTWKTANPVIEGATVVDGGRTWNYNIDIGDRNEVERGKLKAESTTSEDGNLQEGDGEIGEVVRFTVDGDNHRIWVRASGNAIEIMVASIEMSIEDKLQTWRTNLNNLENADRTRASELLSTAETLYNDTKTKAINANREQIESTNNPTDATASQEALTADEEVESAEQNLKRTIGDLFSIFGEGEVEFDATLVESFFTNSDGERKRIYLELVGEKFVLKLEADNPKTYREFLDGIDLELHSDIDAARDARSRAEPILLNIEELERTSIEENATGDEKKEFSRNKARLIDAQAELLVPFTRVLFERSSEIPESTTPVHTEMSGAPNTISSSMVIEILTSNGESGTRPSTASHIVYDTLKKRKNGNGNYYVKGHMLNQSIHGLGGYSNLTPLSVSGNSAHLLNAENTAKIAVNAGSVLKYEVRIGGGTYDTGIPTKSEMDSAGIPEEKHNILKEIKAMEKYVPKQLIVSLYTLREDGDSGNFIKERDVYKNKPIINPVETSLSDYQIGEGESTRKIVLANDTISEIASSTDVNVNDIIIIVDLIKNGDLKQFRSIRNAIENNINLVDDKDLILESLNKLQGLHRDNKLKINESN